MFKIDISTIIMSHNIVRNDNIVLNIIGELNIENHPRIARFRCGDCGAVF